MKLVLWIAIIAAVFWLARMSRSGGTTKSAGTADTGQQRRHDSSSAPSEPMLQCRHCGIYLPASDAVPGAAGEVYCCDAHRVAQPRA